ncbi:MAG: transglutaminase family protein [Acidimicrobiia bacterium]
MTRVDGAETPRNDEWRAVSAHLEAKIVDEADIALAIGVASDYERHAEQLVVALDGAPLAVHEVAAPHHGRLHIVKAVPTGRLVVDYRCTVSGTAAPPVLSELEWFQYLRPSRYCESDRLGPFARAQFAGLAGGDLLASISSWVGVNVGYVPGSSRPIDGAVATLLGREGVCRDFAHLAVALLRANGIPARVVSVYAPGLVPMDFHAVIEACIDDQWRVLDPTCLAPRGSMVRIATGADAADTAFLTNLRGGLELTGMEVTAVVSPALPLDDIGDLVHLG